MPIVPVVLLGALVYAFVQFLRYLTAGHIGSAITQLVVWTAGVGAVLITAQTQFAGDVVIGKLTLAQLSTWSQIWIGLQAASLFSAVRDTQSAIDGTQSAAAPRLFNMPRPFPPRAPQA